MPSVVRFVVSTWPPPSKNVWTKEHYCFFHHPRLTKNGWVNEHHCPFHHSPPSKIDYYSRYFHCHVDPAAEVVVSLFESPDPACRSLLKE